ncbi:MAG: hypothetical protein CMQ20_05950 [Gammaproteobacteria bacterium]|nr:hypothetical protein [Gammaproteobacteria bacterium]
MQEVEPEPEPEPEPVVEVPVPVEEQVEPAFVLPLLNDSDQLIRDGVVSLTRREGVNAWLSPNELIRKFVAFVDGVAIGQVSKDPVRVLTPEGPFLVSQISEEVYLLDSASYKRYDFFTSVVISLDSRRTAEFYLLVHPMLQEAYDELGYPNEKFNEVVFKAIGRLLETPVINKPIRLVRPVVMYQFEDQKLESLSAAQKQLIRMGPKNTRALQVKLSEMALELRSLLENG